MANYAILDENNLVENLIVYNLDNPDPSWILIGDSDEDLIRAAVGSYYDSGLQTFSGIQPFPSWTRNVETNEWVAPVSKPTDHEFYRWDEASQQWIDEQPTMLEVTEEVVDVSYEVGDRRISETGTYEVWDGDSWNDAGEYWSNLSE